MKFNTHEVSVFLRVQDELRGLIEIARAPEEVSAFLLDYWASLLAGISANLGEHDPDWSAAWETVHDLLWSLAPKQRGEDVQRLLQLLPLLIERLHDGCEALGLDARLRDTFFAHLAMLHAATLRAGVSGGETQDLSREAQDSGSDASPTGAVDIPASPYHPAISPQGADAWLDVVQLGAWVDVRGESKPKRMRLQWISPMRGMFLFTDSEGIDALSLTRGGLRERLASGAVRLAAD